MRRLSRITVITVACALAVPVTAATVSFSASAKPASAHPATVTYRGTLGHAQRITASTRHAAVRADGRGAAARPAASVTGPLLIPMIADSAEGPVSQTGATRPVIGASVASSPITAPARPLTGQASVLARFNGMSMHDSVGLNGRTATPPDQGLCAGHDPSLTGDPMVIWEGVNLAAREIAPDGTQLRPDQTLKSLFQDPFNLGDVRCIWDPSAQSFIFSSIGFPLATGPNASETNTTVDVAVLNSHGFASYQFDTSLGGQCLGDQPKLGFNIDAVIVSTDEFCGAAGFQGAIALVISLRQLVTEAATVNDAVLGPATLPGNIVLGMDPVYGPGFSTAYLVNSFPFNDQGNANLTANTLGFWTITDTASVTRGTGSPVLTGTVIPSERYGFPVRAVSTGTGAVVAVINGRPITSEAFLNPNDSRINSQLQAIQAPLGGIQIYAVLNTALTPAGDTAVRDGAAWFQINALTRQVVNQGYVAASGAYLLDPVIAKTRNGTPSMTFAVTSSTINPSAAFATINSGITIVAAGAGPHISYADRLRGGRPRWGDYSAATVLPGDLGIWLATEYIPPAASQDPQDNWGTEIFEISG